MNRCLLPHLVVVSLLVSACDIADSDITIGSGGLSEEKLLAEIMALTLEDSGAYVERSIPSGDSRTNLMALQTGGIDIYPEYDGTLLSLAGIAADIDGEEPAVSMTDLAEDLQLRWLDEFGFDNDIAVAVRRDLALRFRLETLSDLAALSMPLAVAADSGMLARPRDGLYPLARFYGLPLGDVVEVAVSDREAIYDLLLKGQVDAAIVSTVDAQAAEYGVILLDDDLDFFPDYRAAPLARAAAVERHPDMLAALERLSGRITDADISRLVRQIDHGGLDYRDVARSFLYSIDMIERGKTGNAQLFAITLAIAPTADYDESSVRAARAIREVIPGRPLEVETFENPGLALQQGDALIALLGAEDFFRMSDGAISRIEGMEVIGVAGARYAHILTRNDTGLLRDMENLQIGVGPAGGSSYRIGALLSRELGIEDINLIPITDPVERVSALQSGSVDALLIMASLGNSALISLLANNDNLELRPVDLLANRNFRLRYSFLRPARIPADTYPAQTEPLSTLSSQAVLAAAAASETSMPGEAGPGYIPGLESDGLRNMPARTARRLHDALDQAEAPDPILPASSGVLPAARATRKQVESQPAAALLNVLALAFLFWVGSLYFKPIPDEPALQADKSAKKAGGK